MLPPVSVNISCNPGDRALDVSEFLLYSEFEDHGTDGFNFRLTSIVQFAHHSLWHQDRARQVTVSNPDKMFFNHTLGFKPVFRRKSGRSTPIRSTLDRNPVAESISPTLDNTTSLPLSSKTRRPRLFSSLTHLKRTSLGVFKKDPVSSLLIFCAVGSFTFRRFKDIPPCHFVPPPPL